MNPKYTIKNFRIFEENGATIELAPITILTGENSSGKSSIIESILLLNDCISEAKEDITSERHFFLNSYFLNFTKKPASILGKFENVVNNKSLTKEITYEYEFHSNIVNSILKASLSFKQIQKDKLNDGFLSRFTISKH
jgi:AAA15 family ATPase/GTPase